MESAVRALFSDVLEMGERIIIQVEEKWGDSTYFVDIQDRELSGNSVLQVVRLQQVSVLYTVESYFLYTFIYGTVSAKIAPRLKCYKNASRLNRYNFPTDNAIDFLFSTLHTTPFHYEVLKIGSR